MMRNYKINFNRVINQLTPHYLGGRLFILFVQSLVYPLQTLNNRWYKWANEKVLEAKMTSQVIMFEQYLTYKYSKYFLNKTQRVSIIESKVKGIPLYEQSVQRTKNDMILYNESDKAVYNPPLQWEYQRTVAGAYDFEVSFPKCDTRLISEEDFKSMVTFEIERYRIAGMKYKIYFN